MLGRVEKSQICIDIESPKYGIPDVSRVSAFTFWYFSRSSQNFQILDELVWFCYQSAGIYPMTNKSNYDLYLNVRYLQIYPIAFCCATRDNDDNITHFLLANIKPTNDEVYDIL